MGLFNDLNTQLNNQGMRCYTNFIDQAMLSKTIQYAVFKIRHTSMSVHSDQTTGCILGQV